MMKIPFYRTKIRRICATILVTLCMLLCSCTSSPHISEAPEPTSRYTESELLAAQEAYVYAMLDTSRPKEAYSFPDFSGEITDVRVTIRERGIDMSCWNGGANERAYDIFYGYLSDGVWYDFPSGNYALKDLFERYEDGWKACGSRHAVEIGDYILLAFPVGMGRVSEDVPSVIINDTLNSNVLEITEYYHSGSEEVSFNGRWHFYENMHAYGTVEYDFYLIHFDQWYFIVLDRDDFTEGYSVTIQENWAENYHDSEYTYTYEDIMNALNRE